MQRQMSRKQPSALTLNSKPPGVRPTPRVQPTPRALSRPPNKVPLTKVLPSKQSSTRRNTNKHATNNHASMITTINLLDKKTSKILEILEKLEKHHDIKQDLKASAAQKLLNATKKVKERIKQSIKNNPTPIWARSYPEKPFKFPNNESP